MILEKIATQVRIRVEEQKQELPLALLQEKNPFAQGLFLFQKALDQPGIQIIAEIKKASPSAGVIEPDFNPEQIARDYAAAGVAAISVLTELDFFHGSLEIFKKVRQQVKQPLLRKDFLVDSYQIYQSRFFGANCILLIVTLLSPAKLKEFMKIATSLGLDALVEVHDEEELETALAAEASIIGINNRNLRTFKVDLDTTFRLAEKIPEGKIVISESGIKTPAEVKALAEAGVDAILVGETLMRAPDKKAAVRNLFESY